MRIVWRAGPLSVRQVNERLRRDALAHTTVMTTLDRLYKKGLLARSRDGVAYIYRAALSEAEYRQRLVETTVTGLMTRPADAEPVLAAFVDAAAELDEHNLARLEALIAERRKRGE